MPEPKIGITTESLRLPLRRALAAAAGLGARGVRINGRTELAGEELSRTGARQFARLLDDCRLNVAAIAFPTRRGFADSDDLDRRVAATREALKQAAALGAKFVVLSPGRIPAADEGAPWFTLLEVLHDLGSYGQRVGALPLVTAGQASPDDLGRVLAELPEGLIGVDLDPGQLTIQGISPVAAAEKLSRHILQVTATDAVYDLGAGRGAEVQLGRGTVDYPGLLGALEEHEFRGWFIVRRDGAAYPAGELADGVLYLKSLWE